MPLGGAKCQNLGHCSNVVFTSKCLVEVSLSEYISLTTHQKAFIFEPWVPERVSFYAMSLAPEFMPRGGAKGQNLGHC